jgi:hypothetical protein
VDKTHRLRRVSMIASLRLFYPIREHLRIACSTEPSQAAMTARLAWGSDG